MSQGNHRPSTQNPTLEGEGGDSSTNKIVPFPGYREADVVDDEENENSWSEHTFDSEEEEREKHYRNVCFSFLCLMLSCILIVAAIIILYMASVRDMKPTVLQKIFSKVYDKEVLAANSAKLSSCGVLNAGEESLKYPYEFGFSSGLLK